MSRIAQARKEKGYTVRQAAELAGISKTHFSMVELGKRRPSGPLAIRLSQVLGLDFQDVFQRST